MSQQTVPDAAFQALFERLLEKRTHLAFVSYALPGPLVTASWRNPVVVKTGRGFHAYAPEQPWSRGSYESPETVEGVDQAWLRIGAERGEWVLRWGPKNGVWPVIL